MKFTIKSLIELERITHKSVFSLAKSLDEDISLDMLTTLYYVGHISENQGYTKDRAILDFEKELENKSLNALMMDIVKEFSDSITSMFNTEEEDSEKNS